jgi:transposase
MSSHEIVGIDVAARKLVVIGERLALAEYENTAAGRGKLVKGLCRNQRPVRVVLEATGIYFLDLACELAAAGIAVMVVNPKATHHSPRPSCSAARTIRSTRRCCANTAGGWISYRGNRRGTICLGFVP